MSGDFSAKEGHYEKLWRDECEAGSRIRRQRDRALKERDDALDALAKAERLLSCMKCIQAGSMSLDRFAAQAKSIGMMDAAKIVAERAELLCPPGRMRKWAFEFSLLVRDITDAATKEGAKS